MDLDDMILISIDDHIIEPSDLFEGGIGWMAFFLDRLDRHVTNHCGRTSTNSRPEDAHRGLARALPGLLGHRPLGAEAP